ncbi:hypothetical protein C7402_103316 [Paraburkholderia unamae]|uniref:Uncharacterized protein n=1 Tax=Paraburkholderia unamae TaxID=219649 RepID=A0ABX5KS94_9BURK|nr:hypothetical protein C7402_103316 [Paraburkholderia unamae]
MMKPSRGIENRPRHCIRVADTRERFVFHPIGENRCQLTAQKRCVILKDFRRFLHDLYGSGKQFRIFGHFALLDDSKRSKPFDQTLIRWSMLRGNRIGFVGDTIEPTMNDGSTQRCLTRNMSIDVAMAHVHGTGYIDNIQLFESVASQK